MGMFAKVGTLGLAKKAFDIVRKPENQARIKSAISSVAARRRKTS